VGGGKRGKKKRFFNGKGERGLKERGPLWYRTGRRRHAKERFVRGKKSSQNVKTPKTTGSTYALIFLSPGVGEG